MRRLPAAVLLLLCAGPGRADEILVFAAASLTESLEEIGHAFTAKTGTAVRFSFGASSDLARQIEAGAPADVFFSADTAKMDALEDRKLVRPEDRREFLSNHLVVVVSSSSTLRVTGAKSLVGLPGIALADPEAVPAGVYARKWLEAEGVWEAIRGKVVPMLDVRAALATVESGNIPAGIVYRTDATISRRVRVAFVVEKGPTITYSAARLTASSSPRAGAFVAFLAGPEGQVVFERRGFTVRQ
jgi:molybdate transport system substrate-binding protein